ncbi:hypothetical protein CC86DRAFT_415799 [Ophiobolus disseminans]|uniref:Ubiquitin-like domain-containing protein n=1 Tax=Ophiobolus disseminans TaxID=1469910 RepID=A0A6A7AKY1_9PLEO|nr:hypothetical protein CC86DRAFT_415799 [Ophiobolus disseminans]
MSNGLSCNVVNNVIVLDDDLRISFLRNIQVPDNDAADFLPPDLSIFPLERVSQYAKKLPKAMADKRGLFFPMYQREAMWIDFESKNSHLIKVFVGGVNAISGEPAVETPATKLRRQNKLAQTSNDGKATTRGLQDYVATPEQPWLDAIATTEGTVRQFVAMPQGSGYSVEAQITGQEVTGGFQFEVTPFDTKQYMTVYVKNPSCLAKQYRLRTDCMVEDLKQIVVPHVGAGPDQQRLYFCEAQMEDGRTLASYGQNTIIVLFRLRGSTQKAPLIKEMGVAPGSKIRQSIKLDTYPNAWLPNRTTVFNVQILNTASFKHVIGREPPPISIDATTYAAHGYPFFELYEEKSDISGNFDSVKSIVQMEDKVEDEVQINVKQIAHGQEVGKTENEGPTELTNPAGPNAECQHGTLVHTVHVNCILM